ncbi:MAG: 4-hydroxy-tetrahydrodipicolinate synthase [Candidatus Azobacteroides sp.]|nr:4-hydroxy-tetrahydrodipicolinate synthase [Candidatus Azobacteroides sp.]
MERRINFQGMGVALVTPFKRDGSVDYPALSRLIDYLLQNETDYLVVLGTTAETPTLSSDEQRKIIQLAVDQAKGQIPIVLGVSGNNTQAVVEKLKKDDYTGIDALLSVVPYYNKPSQEGIYQHYKRMAEATDLPLILYNVPGRTGVNMTAETTLRLAHAFDSIVAVKEASGNIGQITAILRQKPVGFQLISGDDGITFPSLALGAAGVISVIGNAFPLAFSRLVHLALAGNYAEALLLHYRFAELFELLFTDGSPAGVKCMLQILGYIENELRLPLVPVQSATAQKIHEALQSFQSSSY